MADLAVELAGVKLKNRILLSSAEPLRAMAEKPEATLLDDDYKIAMGDIPTLYTLISRTCFAIENMED